jgi:phenylpropionate dioxygenase-like ring-hydroxylating dioxygenase large terminal subunit
MNTAMTTAVRALPALYYTDAGVYARVRERVFFREWQFACHVSRVAKPGDFFTFSILDQDLAVVHGRDGKLRCFYNVCQHRAHTLLQGSGSKRLLVCPYHAWSYELDGHLRKAPGTDHLTDFDATTICLTEVRLDAFCGFLLVNLDPDAAAFADTFPGVETAVRALCPNIETRIFAQETRERERCNWLVAVENYNECYHCKVVHPTFASGVIDPSSYTIAPIDGIRCLRHSARAQSGPSAWYDTSGSDYGSFFLWPAFSLQIYPSGMVNTYHWRPLAVDSTEVHRQWYSPDGTIDEALQKVMDLDRETTFAEDLRLVENVQRGLGSRGYRPGQLVVNPGQGIDSEHSIAALHNWLLETVGA